MKHFNKIASVCFSIALGLSALTGCEGGEIYEVNAPDWISEKVDSIANSNKTEDEVLEGMQEDVYTIGSTDYSSGFWTVFSKDYVVPDGQKWNAVFNLHINPSASNTYKNFGLVICSDADRGGEGYLEYGVIRFDNQPSGNSEWGDYIDRSYVQSTLTFETDTDAGIDQLGGKVTLTVDRTDPEAFNVTITNGVVTKTYKQPTALVNLNADTSNTNIRCFLVPEGSYIDFLQTNIVPIGGLTSADDKNPISMELQNVPTTVNVGTPLDSIVKNIKAVVTFEEGVTSEVTADELIFSAIPDLETEGTKTLVAIYNKTFKGENCDLPVMASATFKAVVEIASIEVTAQPTNTIYKYYAAPSVPDCTMNFDPTGLEVTATYVSGTQGVLENAVLSFSGVPAKAGKQTVTITTENGVTTEVTVDVVVTSVATAVTNSTGTVGAEDNSAGWWTVFSDDFNVPSGETRYITFTNYTNGLANWNNFAVILRNADKTTEYAVVRADNFGWGSGYDGNTGLLLSGGQADWATWLAAMNGAKVTLCVANLGDGTADVQAVMQGTDGKTYFQSYSGITVDAADLQFALTIEGGHLVFE